MMMMKPVQWTMFAPSSFSLQVSLDSGLRLVVISREDHLVVPSSP